MSQSTPKQGLLFSMLALCTLVAAALAFATVTQADDDVDVQMDYKAVVKLVLDDADVDVIELDASDMEIGDSRQFFTDSGKEVVITRSEAGFEITVDGEELDLPAIHQEKKVVIVKSDGEHGEDHEFHQVFVSGMGDHENHGIHEIVIGGEDHDGEHVFHHSGSGSSQMVFISKDGEKTEIDGDAHGFAWAMGEGAEILHLGGQSAAEHLEESGALDNLDEATRERILEALREHGDSETKVRVIKTGKGGAHEH